MKEDMMWNDSFNLRLKILMLAFFYTLTLPALAVPALSVWQTLEQPDGTSFQAKLHGDERFSWIELEGGYVALLNRDTRAYEYAIVIQKAENLKLQHSGVQVGQPIPEGSNIQPIAGKIIHQLRHQFLERNQP